MVIGEVRKDRTLAVLRNVTGEVMHGGKKVGMPQMKVGGGNLFDPEVSNREEEEVRTDQRVRAMAARESRTEESRFRDSMVQGGDATGIISWCHRERGT